MTWLTNNPGRIYVLATLLPLAAFVVLALGGSIRGIARARRSQSGGADFVYYLFGGDKPLKAGAYFATVCIAGSAILAMVALTMFLDDTVKCTCGGAAEWSPRWQEHCDWAQVASQAVLPAAQLQIGYRIDQLSALLFVMVTVISTGIFVFSLGYMCDETEPVVTDHEVAAAGSVVPGQGSLEDPAEAATGHDRGYWKRRGRYGRFFLYLSLFCFSMLNLLIADNLFQVFISWELVGVCSFFLIGFYFERHSAAVAANKAFIMNRVGDAGFLVGLAIFWACFGTFNFQQLDAKLHATPAVVSIPHWLLVVAGLGIFLGCVGKSAQFPLQTWLPDAMEGPTPVSALIHAATMVAAGVYLVGRAYPLFTPEVLLVIAYTGGITLFLAATIALVQHDIKRVLAYSTVSQLGYMMLALGVGGWAPGLFHLITHAFFKALLFLAAGAVIFGVHHEQDMRKMGGLRHKMPITAWTMLVGVLAIAGTPFFSGWYSKDQIIGQALGFCIAHPEHTALAVLPILATALTGLYMFRLWFLTFAGTPRDEHLHEAAHEAPLVMTIPLVILALFSLGAGWGPEFWKADSSPVGLVLRQAQPDTVTRTFAEATHAAHEYHLLAGALALAAAAIGVAAAIWIYGLRRFEPAWFKSRLPALYQLFCRKWFFDEIYTAAFVIPLVKLAFFIARLDKRTTEPSTAAAADRQLDVRSVDGVLSAVGLLVLALGRSLRRLQSGLVRRYVLVLVLTTLMMFAILSFLSA